MHCLIFSGFICWSVHQLYSAFLIMSWIRKLTSHFCRNWNGKLIPVVLCHMVKSCTTVTPYGISVFSCTIPLDCLHSHKNIWEGIPHYCWVVGQKERQVKELGRSRTRKCNPHQNIHDLQPSYWLSLPLWVIHLKFNMVWTAALTWWSLDTVVGECTF